MTKRKYAGDQVLQGNLIYLRRPTLDDAASGPWYSWFNDPEVTRFTEHGKKHHTRQDQIEFFRAFQGDETREVFAICDSKNHGHIGTVSLQEIDLDAGTADIAVVIGDRDYWGTTAATESLDLAAQYGFNNLKLKKFTAGSYAANVPMNLTLVRLGMKIHSTVVDAYQYDDGKTCDKIEWEATQSDWKSIVPLDGVMTSRQEQG